MTREEYLENHDAHEGAEENYGRQPYCPECGRRCEKLYLDRYDDVIGCDNCITTVGADDYYGL